MLDIGASRTAVHPQILRQLKSQESGFLPLVIVGKGNQDENEELPIHDVRILLAHDEPTFHIQAVAVGAGDVDPFSF